MSNNKRAKVLTSLSLSPVLMISGPLGGRHMAQQMLRPAVLRLLMAAFSHGNGRDCLDE